MFLRTAVRKVKTQLLILPRRLSLAMQFENKAWTFKGFRGRDGHGTGINNGDKLFS